MGLTLCNKLVCNTYPGVLKTCDNAALTAAPKPMTDGVGNNVPIALGTACAIYTGTHDFTGATVTGITGAAGLVNGTGTDSMRSDVTTIAACALGTCSIALGNAAYADGCKSIAIGEGATTLCEEGITMGFGTSVSGCAGVAIGRGAAAAEYAVGLGYGASANGLRAVAIGFGTIGTGDCSVTIGCGSAARGTGGVAIGHDSETNTGVQDSVSIGRFNAVAHNQSVALGCCNFIGLICGTGTSNIGIGAVNCVEGSYNISIGSNNCAMNDCSIAIGRLSCNTSNNAIAMGLATCVGTDSHNSIVIGCGAFISNAIATCNNCNNVVIGTGAFITPSSTWAHRNVVIGNRANTSESVNVVIGEDACSTAFSAVAIGYNAKTKSSAAIAIGLSACIGSTAADAIAIGCVANKNFGTPGEEGAPKSISIGCYATSHCDATASINIGAAAGSYACGCYATSIGFDSKSGGRCDIVVGCSAWGAGNGANKMAIGTDSYAANNFSLALGTFTCATNNGSIALGAYSRSAATNSVAIGYNANVTGTNGIAIGCGACAETRTVAIGCNSGPTTVGTGIASVYVGDGARGNWNSAIAIGESAIINGHCAIAIGCNSQTNSYEGISIGHRAKVIAGDDGIAIGKNACVNDITHSCAIAIGVNVCSTRANTLTTCELETCVAGKGLIVKTPDGIRSYRIAVDNSGNLTTTLV
jgi:PIN domain nuclease of toxin-antitoxin system